MWIQSASRSIQYRSEMPIHFCWVRSVRRHFGSGSLKCCRSKVCWVWSSVVVKDWLLEDKDKDKDLESEDEDKDLRSEDEDKDKDLDLWSKDEDKDSNFKCWSIC